MKILAIDPGCSDSAFVVWDGLAICEHGIRSNETLLHFLPVWRHQGMQCVIEQIRGYGVPAGNETFDTCWWTGRFFECFCDNDGRSNGAHYVHMLPRKTIVAYFCGHARGRDSDVRAALIERFGGPSSTKKGGLLYGITSHTWAALAAGVCWWDQNAKPNDGTVSII
jgi:hypothetical protein